MAETKSASTKNKLFVAGGLAGPTGEVATAQIVDISTGVVTPIADLPTPRCFCPAITYRSQCWIVGGWSMKTNHVYNTIEIFDSSSWHHNAIPSLQSPRAGALLLHTKDSLYVMAGGGSDHVLNTMECLSSTPSSSTTSTKSESDNKLEWKSLPNMSIGRAYPAGTVINDGSSLLVIGGSSAPGADPSKMLPACAEIFDISNNTWRNVATPLTRRSCARALTLHDGSVVYAGGFLLNDSGDSLAITDIVDIYTPSTNTWRRADWRLPKPMRSFGFHLCDDGRMILVAGHDGKNSASVIIQNGDAGHWKEIASLATAVHEPASTLF